MARTALRWFLVVLYLTAGVFHLTMPGVFVRITPGWVPMPHLVVLLTGVAELAGAVALAQPWQPWLRRLAGWSLAAYALCVWPANIHHMMMDMAAPGGGWGMGYHIPRMLAQPLLIWAALWSSGAIDWPFARRRFARTH